MNVASTNLWGHVTSNSLNTPKSGPDYRGQLCSVYIHSGVSSIGSFCINQTSYTTGVDNEGRTRKLFVFAGECVVLVLQFLHGGSEARQFGLQSLVVAAGAVELDGQLVDATLHVARRALGVLQTLSHVARVRVRLHNDQPRAPTSVGRLVGV